MRSDDGTVEKDIALRVLADYDVVVTDQGGTFVGMQELKKGDIIDVRRIPDRVGKKMLHYLARKFNIPIHRFYD